MADPHSLAVGDTVTHPDWPEGETAVILSLHPYRRYDGARRRLVDDSKEVICLLDRQMPDAHGEADNGWMEGGLIRLSREAGHEA